MRSRPIPLALAAAAFWLLSAVPVRADVVTLKDGRQWEGTIVSESAEKVVIDTVGGPVGVARSDIAEVRRGPTRRQQYQERRARVAEDDLEGQLALARWCREQGLRREALYHYQLVLALEPENSEAHRALGHQQVGGRWLTYEEAMAARGLVRYQGRWLEPAEAERARNRDLRRALERSWRRRLGVLVRAFLSGGAAERARSTAQLLAVEDPVAAPAVVELLKHRDGRVRALALKVVERQGFRGGDEALVRLALGGQEPEVRRLARLALVRTTGDRALKLLVAALASERAETRRRAAAVLGELGDPRVVPALIESIRETVLAGNTGGPVIGRLGGEDRPIVSDIDTVVAPGVAVMKPRIERITSAVGAGSRGQLQVRTIVNYEAVDALEAITGKEFGDDQEAWRRWWKREGRSFLRGLRTYNE